MEEWRTIPEFEGCYEVSNLGKIRRLAYILKGGQHEKGYSFVNLPNKRGKPVHRYIHRLVAEVFLGDPPSALSIVHHKDGNARNNHVENLEWSTTKRNSQIATKQGKLTGNRRTYRKGSAHPESKLTEEQVILILQSYQPRRGSFIELARKYGVSKSLIEGIIKGQRWKHIPRVNLPF